MDILDVFFDLRRKVSRREYVLASGAVLVGYHLCRLYGAPQVWGRGFHFVDWSFLDTLSLSYAVFCNGVFDSDWQISLLLGMPFRWLLLSLCARRARDGGVPAPWWVGVFGVLLPLGEVVLVAMSFPRSRPAVGLDERAEGAASLALVQFLLLFLSSVFGSLLLVGFDGNGRHPIEMPAIAFIPAFAACLSSHSGELQPIHVGLVIANAVFAVATAVFFVLGAARVLQIGPTVDSIFPVWGALCFCLGLAAYLVNDLAAGQPPAPLRE